MPRFHSETAETVAGAIATQLLADLWAGADLDRKAELHARLAPYLSAAIFTYCEAVSGAWGFIPVPSAN